MKGSKDKMSAPSELADAATGASAMLTSALAADALDEIGFRHQCLSSEIQPLMDGSHVVGRAHTARAVESTPGERKEPYDGLLAAIDSAPKGAVFVIGTGHSDSAGIWGELVSTASVARGLSGILTDGLTRDTNAVKALGFAVFSRGRSPYDSKGRVEVVEHGLPVDIDNVRIHPGDLVVADSDGVCIVPSALEARVIELVRRKRRVETEFREAVASMSASAAFRKFGIL